jgi:hypothetical protein
VATEPKTIYTSFCSGICTSEPCMCYVQMQRLQRENPGANVVVRMNDDPIFTAGLTQLAAPMPPKSDFTGDQEDFDTLLEHHHPAAVCRKCGGWMEDGKVDRRSMCDFSVPCPLCGAVNRINRP